MSKRKYHHEDLRSILVKAASILLEEEGMENLTMRNLSKKVGVSRSAPYRHFQDKTALLGAVAAEGFNRLGDTLACLPEEDVEPVRRFRLCSCAYVRFAVNSPRLYTLMFGFELAGGAPVPELTDSAERAFSGIVECIISCQNENAFKRSNPLGMANVCWSSLHGLSMLLIGGAVSMAGEGGRLHDLSNNSQKNPAGDVPEICHSLVDTLVKGFTSREPA